MIFKQLVRNEFTLYGRDTKKYVVLGSVAKTYNLSKRITDILVVVTTLPVTLPIMLLVSCILRLYSSDSVFYFSTRVGRDGKRFVMPKFRTMHANTPDLPPYQLENRSQFITPIGSILRKLSLDEIPQIWCILCGSMSVVGPSPAGVNEPELIDSRSAAGIDRLVPGLTGWAQINGRNTLSVLEKVEYEIEYLTRQSWLFDLQIVLRTVPNVLKAKDVRT